MKQIDRKNHLFLFSSFDHDGHFEESIIDEAVDVEKIVQTQMMIDSVRDALSKLSDEEREIIDRLYFNDEILRKVAKEKSIAHPTLIIWRLFNVKNRLEEIRKEKGITQEELANALELSRQTVGSLENGRYNPSIILAFKIANYFDLTIEEIFIYEED